jgi:type II secretory pathway pseudopilin PulG
VKKRDNFQSSSYSLHMVGRVAALSELLVVVAILGILSSVVVMNIDRFVGVGQEEVRKAEEHQVQAAALCYLSDGNTLSEPFTVGPDDQGVLDRYLIGNLMYRWAVDVDGGVSLAKGDSDEPKPEPEPKPIPLKL